MRKLLTTGRSVMSRLINLLAMIFFTTSAHADWKDSVREVFFFATGIVTSFAVHEAGHALAARAYGEKLDWHGSGFNSEWSCRYPCWHIEQVSVAGNLSTAIVGEMLLRLPGDYRHTPFVDGMQAFNTINPITYDFKNASEDGGHGDYRSVDESAQVALALHAASIGYRQFSGRLWTIVPHGVQFRLRF